LFVSLGCSVAFGIGVNDHETLAAQVVRRVGDAAGLNFGGPAYGPQHAWLQLQDPAHLEALRGRRGLAVYVFLDHHLHRLAGSGALPRGWRAQLPWLALRRGQVIPFGFFAERDAQSDGVPGWLRGLRLYTLVEGPLSRAAGAPPPEVEAAEATELFAQVMAECAQALRAVAPELAFRVLLYPGVHAVNRVGGALASRGVGVMNYSACAEPSWSTSDMYLMDGPDGGPGHPHARLNSYVGAHLARDFLWTLGRVPEEETQWTPGLCNPRAESEDAVPDWEGRLDD
jgi:hypothetical protein